jgi:hypothetical protein
VGLASHSSLEARKIDLCRSLKLKMFSGMGFNLVPSQSDVPPKVLIRELTWIEKTYCKD